MALRYVRSTDGSDADNGTTWPLAKATVAGAAAIDTAGDTIWVSDNHAESTAGNVSIALAGTLAAPTKLLCGDDAAEPPTALATTASVTTTGSGAISIGGVAAYVYGISFNISTGATSNGGSISASWFEAEQCNFSILATATSVSIALQAADGLSVFRNCGFKFGAATQGLTVGSSTTTGTVHIKGGSLLAGGTSPTNLVRDMFTGSVLEVDGLDLTNASAGINLVNDSGDNSRATFRNMRLPASWSGVLNAATPGFGSVFEMFNCDSADTHYTYRKATQLGTIRDETTLVRTGGASDGTTTYSLKLETNANAEHPLLTLDTPEMVKWNDTTGSSITVTVEFLHDSATALKDNEIFLDAMYLGTSGVPLASFVSDGISVVATAADQADSSETWTTTGMSNPNTRKLSVSFTPQEAGFIHAVVRVAKASTTVYVDPMVTVS